MIQKPTKSTFCFIEKPASEEETSLSTGYLWYLAVLGVVRVPHANADDVRRPTSCPHHVGSLPALLGLVVPAPWCAAPMVVGAIVGLSSAPVRGWRPPVPPGGIATSRRACHATTRRARFGTDRRRPSKHHARSIHARLLHLTTILVLKDGDGVPARGQGSTGYALPHEGVLLAAMGRSPPRGQPSPIAYVCVVHSAIAK